MNFSLYSKNRTEVELLRFDTAEDNKPSNIIRLDSRRRCTAHYWHVFVPERKIGQIYGYRVQGPFDPGQGHRFDGQKLLLDPYARCVVAGKYQRNAAKLPGDNTGSAMKCVVTGSRNYDWEGDTPPHRPFSQTVIYELHVGGAHATQLRRGRRKKGNVCGIDREDSTPVAIGHYGGGTVTRVSV